MFNDIFANFGDNGSHSLSFFRSAHALQKLRLNGERKSQNNNADCFIYVLERISRKLPLIIVKLQVESTDISKRQSYWKLKINVT